jgi:hypothetical protein
MGSKPQSKKFKKYNGNSKKKLKLQYLTERPKAQK